MKGPLLLRLRLSVPAFEVCFYPSHNSKKNFTCQSPPRHESAATLTSQQASYRFSAHTSLAYDPPCGSLGRVERKDCSR
jgi:hypothetical protein